MKEVDEKPTCITETINLTVWLLPTLTLNWVAWTDTTERRVAAAATEKRMLIIGF